jgi:hypothetical protein
VENSDHPGQDGSMPNRIWDPVGPREWSSVDLLFGSRFTTRGASIPMNETKAKKAAPVHSGFEWAGAMARVRRGSKSVRAGRRGALLSMLTSAYVNSNRAGRISDRTTGER